MNDVRPGSGHAEDQDHLLWLRYLGACGDRAMSVRLKAIWAVGKVGRSAVTGPDGVVTSAPLMVAAEACAAALEDRDERWWRQDWNKRLVSLAVRWREVPTTQGVVSTLILTDRIIEDLKALGVWPWAGEHDEARPGVSGAPLPRLTYTAEESVATGIEAVHGADYVVWHRLLEMSGDGPVATRLAAIHAASQSGCRMTVETADGHHHCFPTMIVAEGALAAHRGRSEAQWREEWTRQCVRIVRRWPDKETIDAVSALLDCTSLVVAELKYARVWPWLGTPKSERDSAEGRAKR